MKGVIYKVPFDCVIVRKAKSIFEKCAGILRKPDLWYCGIDES